MNKGLHILLMMIMTGTLKYYQHWKIIWTHKKK